MSDHDGKPKDGMTEAARALLGSGMDGGDPLLQHVAVVQEGAAFGAHAKPEPVPFPEFPDKSEKDLASADVSRADQLSYAAKFAKDPAFQKWAYQLAQVRSAEAKVGRAGWITSFIFMALSLVFGGYSLVLLRSIMHFRFPFVLADPSTGDVSLVQAVDHIQGNGLYPDKYVLNQIDWFYEASYGVSDYHARVLWPRVKEFWLPQAMANKFAAARAAEYDQARENKYMRRVTVVKKVIEQKIPSNKDNGGVKYFVNVEYVEEDIALPDQNVTRRTKYSGRIICNVGAQYGQISTDGVLLLGKMNPLNIQVVELSEPQGIFLDPTSPMPSADSPFGQPRTRQAIPGGQNPSQPQPNPGNPPAQPGPPAQPANR